MIGKFILKAVVGPFVSTVAAKAGEAVGDLLAYHINPPEPEECQHSHLVSDVDGTVTTCVRCGEHVEA